MTFRHSGTEYFTSTVIPFFFGMTSRMGDVDPLDMENNIFKAAVLEAADEQMNKCYDRLESEVSAAMQDGKVIYEYKKSEYAQINSECVFERNLFGLRCLCINCGGNGSLNFTITGAFDPSRYDMMIKFYFNGEKWCYGFYSDGHDDIDCSEIAKKFGGGGHRCASGCTTDVPIEGLINLR